jgi:hypothetical protein
MSGGKKSFLIHIDSLDILDDLTNEQAGELFNAIRSHQIGEEMELHGVVRIAFSPFKNQFKRDDEKYQTTCKRRAEAGSKGGKQKVANASNSKQKVANVADNKTKNKNKTKSDSDNYIKDQRPVGLNCEAWDLWITFRAKCKFKKYKTDSAMKKIITMGNEQTQALIIQQSINNEYQGLFPVKQSAAQQQPDNWDDDNWHKDLGM